MKAAGVGYWRPRPARTQIFKDLERSFSLHVRRPWILAVVVAGSVAQFGIEIWAESTRPVPADLAGMFAAPPLDSFTWIYSGVGLVPLVMLFAVRMVVVCLFVLLILGIAPTKDNLLRTSGVYLLSVLTFGGLFAALTWFGPRLASWLAGLLASSEGDPYSGEARFALGLIYFFLFLPLVIVAAVGISPLLAKAAAGESLKVRLDRWSIWVLVSMAALLYLVFAISGQRQADLSSGSFFRAFVVLSLQSLIYGAVVHSSAAPVLRALGK